MEIKQTMKLYLLNFFYLKAILNLNLKTTNLKEKYMGKNFKRKIEVV